MFYKKSEGQNVKNLSYLQVIFGQLSFLTLKFVGILVIIPTFKKYQLHKHSNFKSFKLFSACSSLSLSVKYEKINKKNNIQ